MKFIGNSNNEFNAKLIPLLYDTTYTILSCIGGNYSYDSSDSPVIQLLPVDDEFNYYETVNKAWSKMIKNAFYDTLSTCTSIIIVKPELVDVAKVAKIIKEFDKNNLVDNIWVYPDPIKNLQLRNNSIEDLPYQKSIAKK